MTKQTKLQSIKASKLRGLLPHSSPLFKSGQALCSLLLLTAIVLPAYKPPTEPPPRKPPTSFTGTPPELSSVLQSALLSDH